MISSNAVPSMNWGSLMHGMLMEHLQGAWPFLLHEGDRRALTQWVEPLPNNQFNWHVHLLDDQLAVSFLEICQTGDEWFCQHNGSKITVLDVAVKESSIMDYSQKYMSLQHAGQVITIHFKTPTTHKSQGKYVLFPSVDLIINSIRNRIGAIDEAVEPSEDLIRQLTDQTDIRNYQLQTALFGMEGSWIKGYTGHLSLNLKGDNQLLRFGHMFFGLAEWFGIGIKTTLGMGGCIVTAAG